MKRFTRNQYNWLMARQELNMSGLFVGLTDRREASLQATLKRAADGAARQLTASEIEGLEEFYTHNTNNMEK